MKIFIQDVPVNIIPVDAPIDTTHFDKVINCREAAPDFGKLSNDVLLQNANAQQIDKFLLLLKQNKFRKLEEITFTVWNYDGVIKHVKSNFTIIKAAGGLVFKQGEILMIYRLKKWDLPKGKLDDGESSKEGAIREVEEECNIKVELGEKICDTWHTYKRNGKKILKKTKWYAMRCVDDTSMRPQVEEDIEDLKWMDERELRQALYNTYPSIRYVFRQYYNQDHNW